MHFFIYFILTLFPLSMVALNIDTAKENLEKEQSKEDKTSKDLEKTSPTEGLKTKAVPRNQSQGIFQKHQQLNTQIKQDLKVPTPSSR